MNEQEKNGANQLENIVYISIPAEMNRTIGDFSLDPSIPLPVELRPGQESLDLKDLSWEMIIAAMLKVLAYQNDHENANYYRRFILTIKPKIVEELTETAILKAKNRDFDLSEEIFKALDGLLPDNANVKLNLALVYEQRAEAYETVEKPELSEYYTSLAFDMYKQALILDPDSPDIHLNAGYFFLQQKNYEKAARYLAFYLKFGEDPVKRKEVKKILEEIKSQDLLDQMFKEAFDFIKLGKEEEGIAKAKEFLVSHPDVWNGWFLLGWGYRRLERYEEGKEAFLKALEKGPAHPDTLNELAICHMELGEYKKSRSRLEEALKLEPENVKIISNLGIVSLKEKKTDEAKRFFLTALEIDPEDPIAKRYLEFLESES